MMRLVYLLAALGLAACDVGGGSYGASSSSSDTSKPSVRVSGTARVGISTSF